MRNWMRVVLPPGTWIALFIFIYLLILMFIGILYYQFPIEWGLYQLIFTYRDAVVLLGAFSYGVFRSVSFHPVCRSDYLDFLKLSAWTPKKPLLLGPVHLIWQDFVVLLILLAMVWPDPYYHPLAPLFTMLLGYFFGLIFVFQLCHAWKYLYGLAFGCGAAVLFWSNPLVAFVVLSVLYIVAYQGVKESLIELHYSMLEEAISGEYITSDRVKIFEFEQNTTKRLNGWPFDSLAARKPSLRFMKDQLSSIPRVHGVLISLLISWSVFAISVMMFQTSEIDESSSLMFLTNRVPTVGQLLQQELLHPGQSIASRNSEDGVFFLLLPCFILCVFRLSFYTEGHHPPINLWGRLRTFRWIIPEYDKVFISPICIMLVPVILGLASHHIGLSPLFSGPIIITLMFLAALLIGPKRVEWQLTAPCKLARPAKYRKSDTNGFIEL